MGRAPGPQQYNHGRPTIYGTRPQQRSMSQPAYGTCVSVFTNRNLAGLRRFVDVCRNLLAHGYIFVLLQATTIRGTTHPTAAVPLPTVLPLRHLQSVGDKW